MLGAYVSASETTVNNVVLARQRPDGRLAVGVYLIDLGAVELRDIGYLPSVSFEEYVSLLERLCQCAPLAPVSAAYAVRVVSTAARYAARYGVDPHPELGRAWRLFQGIDTSSSNEPVIGRFGG